MEIPIVLTEQGPLQPLIGYFLEYSHARSFSWMQKVIQAVGYLLDYIAANNDCFADPKELFTTFVQRLYTGTIGEDGIDSSGLYWLPKDRFHVRQLSSQLALFSDWMADRMGTKPLNPWRNATSYEEMLNWAAYHQKHNRSFLGHTWDGVQASAAAKRARNTLLKRTPKIEHEGVKSFPDDRFMDLLLKGLVVPGKQKNPRISEHLNLRDILITLLQHCGGLRESEPFHIYVHDVLPDPQNPDIAMVRVFHPSDGQAPPDWMDAKGNPIKCARGAYLRGKYQMRPRTEYFKTDPLHAGWKDSLLDSKLKFMHVHWFPAWSGKLFKKLWDIYLLKRALKDCSHPFAFVSQSGRPYAIRDYNEAHERAIMRIGLIPAKMNGTTPHGHRHAYGQRMANAGIDPLYRKKALHHKSLESQSVYTEPTIEKVTDAIERASSVLGKGKILEPPEFMNWTEEF